MEMEFREGVGLTVMALTCIAAVSYSLWHLVFRHYYQRRSRKCCQFTEAEDKPQNHFKKVLADNSFSDFNHLLPQGSHHPGKIVDRHPYGDEITSLLENSPPTLDLFMGIEQTSMDGSYTWIHTLPQLESLAKLLSKERIFAVDTEQHSLRSFLGFTALMQISTEKEDYLLDTIALHDVMDVLRPIFANPSICKILHGADNDILWLQRDFHIYVVNLFDTAKACELLSKPYKSLAYLLQSYCGISSNKLLQLADWRQRPLSEEMVEYARGDAHYLLYIAKCLAIELENHQIGSNLFHEVSLRSNMLCLQLYEKDTEAFPGDSTAASILARYMSFEKGGILQKCEETMQIMRLLCKWRDMMARIHDESLRFVLSDQAIMALATNFPQTIEAICETISEADSELDFSEIYYCSSLSSPSPVVYSHIKDVSHLLQANLNDFDYILTRMLETYLGNGGSFSLSAQKYAITSTFNLKLTNGLCSKRNGAKPMRQASRKASRELFVQKFSCKSPVYHNCRIYANDGRLLCYCDCRKVAWYLHRQLATLIEDDPPAIMLLFEPKGRPEDDDNDFYVQSKKNMCVGCGERNHYLRYRIIPSCYRAHFPEHLKSHRSHDIVLLCVDCHEIAHAGAEKYKKQIASEFGIPLFLRKVAASGQGVDNNSDVVHQGIVQEEGVSPLQLRTAAMALLRHGSKMPSKRREELIMIVRTYFGGREVSDRDLETALLVGMSPHERRRLSRKRGSCFKQSADKVLVKEPKDGKSRDAYQSRDGVTLAEDHHMTAGLQFSEDSCIWKSMELDIAKVISTDERAASSNHMYEFDSFHEIHIGGDDHGELKSTMRKPSSKDNKGHLDSNHVDLVSGKATDGSHRSNEVAGYSAHETCTSNYSQKLSLLGHGPHGKQVVEYILKKSGEEGIQQFCQRWRQVFVESICPRFLPVGWDVMHSGRREFGDYSVYKPDNKTT
ncbi:hypothetical protein AMTRI_Chr02g215870 [Amborella trichopoda]|uniref:protein RRP6-like 3 n=1 Tax=Amborella trichopoda TaxID=13333 RepID=UPI0009C15AE6|nr:protein RRP6-like 3 [Amborella trichopoda]XP_020530091.1 protein RRP6-like 3 [Amborella trichopoda]|eukprot:XP_020530090.1 protein RRP6-like 3 [Amborella trichopoda]